MTDLASITWTRAARNEARALVRSQAGFDGWIAANSTVDRNSLEKAEIVDAARALSVYDLLAQIIASHTGTSLETVAANVAEDARIEAKLAADPDQQPDRLMAASVDAAIDSVLDPVRQYLSPGLVDGLADRIRPIARQAALPPQVIERIVTVPAAPVAPPGALPFAKIVGQDTMRKTFGLTGPQGKLPVAIWDAADALTPDPTYQVDVATVAQCVTAWEHGETLWLAGPMGSGKGTLCREYAARTRRPFVRIGFERSTEVVDLRGQSEPVPGETHGAKMVWVDKVFVQSIQRPGTFIQLDEITIAPAGTVAWFQTILDERQVTLPSGVVVHFAPGVIVAISDNTAGYGDPSGAYAGTQPANAALVDRCSRLVIVDYLPVAKEALALSQKVGMPHPAALRLAEFAALVRKEAAKAGGEARAFSFRRLVAFGEATFRDKLSIDQSWDITALTRLPEADRETLRTLVRVHFKGDDYLAELNGVAVDAPVSAAPISQAAEQVTARDIFARS